MTSPVSQADLKLSLLDRVSRKLADPEPRVPATHVHSEELILSPDQTNLSHGDGQSTFNRAILASPQDENDNDRNCQMDDCGDMDTSIGLLFLLMLILLR